MRLEHVESLPRRQVSQEMLSVDKKSSSSNLQQAADTTLIFLYTPFSDASVREPGITGNICSNVVSLQNWDLRYRLSVGVLERPGGRKDGTVVLGGRYRLYSAVCDKTSLSRACTPFAYDPI